MISIQHRLKVVGSKYSSTRKKCNSI